LQGGKGGDQCDGPTGLRIVIGGRVIRDEDTHGGGRQVHSIDQGGKGVGTSFEKELDAGHSIYSNCTHTPIAATPEEGHLS